jgi:hypothetical protein
MDNRFTAVFGVALCLTLAAAVPARAQLSPDGLGPSPGAPGGAPQPQARVPDIAPPALPGAGAAPPVATGPAVTKATTGDPTTALFTAVNSGDYNAAQDAISRGANIDAQNALGETPLDLSVALNRSNITFLLLATRNELGGDAGVPSAPVPAPAHDTHHHLRITQANDAAPVHVNVPVMGSNPGTPDPSAGFLGFGK